MTCAREMRLPASRRDRPVSFAAFAILRSAGSRLHADEAMIEFTRAGKRYGRRRGTTALHDISLSIPRGNVCAVVGPNGAGKSTLLGLMLGFLHPTAGEITVGELTPRDYVQANGVGYVRDRFSLPGGWPVRRAMRALCAMQGLDERQADALLHEYGLEAHAAKNIGDLSRGLLQRVGLAQAFAAGRELLVLDEPAEGLDPIWRIRLRDMIANARAAGRTVVLASHDLSEVERVADTVLVLESGMLRDIVHMTSADSDTYRVQLNQPFEGITSVFPDATAMADTSYIVSAAGIDDLNRRISALIELGGRVVSLRHGGEVLEERVRRSSE